MALIVQKLWDSERKTDVDLEDVDMSKVEKDFETENVRVYSYQPFTYPAGKKDSYGPKVVYNGDLDDVPVFVERGNKFVVDKTDLADYLYREYGSGQYQVFKRGGTPPWEPYFENRFITGKNGESV